MEWQDPPFHGNNDENQVQSTARTDSWVEKDSTSLGMRLGLVHIVLATKGPWYSDRCVSIDGPAWTWTVCA